MLAETMVDALISSPARTWFCLAHGCIFRAGIPPYHIHPSPFPEARSTRSSLTPTRQPPSLSAFFGPHTSPFPLHLTSCPQIFCLSSKSKCNITLLETQAQASRGGITILTLHTVVSSITEAIVVLSATAYALGWE